jgi:hypothetical protein
MVVVPLSRGTSDSGASTSAKASRPNNWIRYAAAGTLAASGALLITGNRRAGLLTAVSGAALAVLDQQEAVCAWWDRLPGYLAEIDDMLCHAQAAVADFSAQGQKLRRALGK